LEQVDLYHAVTFRHNDFDFTLPL